MHIFIIPLLIILALGTTNGQQKMPVKGKQCAHGFVVRRNSPCPKALEVHIAPKWCTLTCNLHIEVSIEPHPLNRWWVWEVDGPMFQSGMMQLDGERAAKTQVPVELNALPEGHYTVKVILYRTAKKSEVTRFTTEFIVGY